MSKHLAKFQSRLWRDVEAAHRYYRAEGFTVGKCRCRLCGDEDDGSVEPGADLARLECGRCGAHDSDFIPLE